MKKLKKFIATTALMAMIGSSAHNLSADYCSDTGGCGYEECRRAPCLTPAIALGAIALVAIIAVALQHGGHGHGHHGHSHDSSGCCH